MGRKRKIAVYNLKSPTQGGLIKTTTELHRDLRNEHSQQSDKAGSGLWRSMHSILEKRKEAGLTVVRWEQGWGSKTWIRPQRSNNIDVPTSMRLETLKEAGSYWKDSNSRKTKSFEVLKLFSVLLRTELGGSSKEARIQANWQIRFLLRQRCLGARWQRRLFMDLNIFLN